MYISRSEAGLKLRVSEARLRQLEKQGKLKKLLASEVGFTHRKGHNGGRDPKWVYAESQVAALLGKTGADTKFAREHRIDATVFDLFAQGADLVEVVRQTRLDVPTVQRLRDVYIKEKGAFLVSNEAKRAAEAHGFELKPETFTELLVHLLERARGVKLGKDKLSRLKVVPDDESS